jgi:hypothetical protein
LHESLRQDILEAFSQEETGLLQCGNTLLSSTPRTSAGTGTF